MVIHILDTNEIPKNGDPVEVDCGKKTRFDPIDACWDDGRICEECRRLHSQPPLASADRSFALAESKE